MPGDAALNSVDMPLFFLTSLGCLQYVPQDRFLYHVGHGARHVAACVLTCHDDSDRTSISRLHPYYTLCYLSWPHREGGLTNSVLYPEGRRLSNLPPSPPCIESHSYINVERRACFSKFSFVKLQLEEEGRRRGGREGERGEQGSEVWARCDRWKRRQKQKIHRPT